MADQQQLPFAAAEGSFEERRMTVELAIKACEPDLYFEQIVRYVFHVTEKTGRPIAETYGALAERFHCSRDTVKRRVTKAARLGIFKLTLIKAVGGWNAANEIAID